MCVVDRRGRNDAEKAGRRAGQQQPRTMSVRKATIADVAQLAGVSTATAGRVLGGYGYSSEDKKARVLRAAETLGYQPNHLARSLITGRTRTIGVVTAGIQRQLYAAIVRGIADTAEREGFGVLIANSDETPDEELRAIRNLTARQVDGLIVAPCGDSSDAHLRGLDGQLPIVLLDREVAGLDVDSVAIDNVGAARDCVARLIAAGHEAIGLALDLPRTEARSAADFVTRPRSRGLAKDSMLHPGWQRFHGYLLAHEDAGLQVDLSLLAQVADRRAEAAETAALDLLQAPRRPTALVAGSARMTRGIMSALLKTGHRIPDDLSFVGFDDLDWMSFMSPGYDAVAQPRRRMGETAAKMLIDRISGLAEAPRHLRLAPQQAMRGSVRAIAAGG